MLRLPFFSARHPIAASLPWVSGFGWTAACAAGTADLPPDYLEQVTKKPAELRLTLPNGKQVLGKIEDLNRNGSMVDRLTGKLVHPEPGSFSLNRSADGVLTGSLAFDEQTTEWTIQPSADTKTFRWVELPVRDAFRPRRMELPKKAPAGKPGAREDADLELTKGLKVEALAGGRLRVGEVVLDKGSRSIRFPGVVNMHDGTVEYGIVTSTGKRHEALFSTTATPRDIHLAMLLLGAKPAPCVETQNGSLKVPDGSAVEVRVEWKTDGVEKVHPIQELITLAKTSTQMRERPAAPDPRWLYNGSKFNDAGFAASVEGSIVSLIADDLALINNAGGDRTNDEIHLPESALLPKTDTPVTLILSLIPVSPKPANP